MSNYTKHLAVVEHSSSMEDTPAWSGCCLATLAPVVVTIQQHAVISLAVFLLQQDLKVGLL